MSKWICQCNAINAQFAPRCHNCERGENPGFQVRSALIWKNTRTGERSPAMCELHNEQLFEDRVGNIYCHKCARACPACRGYDLERSWCSVCNKAGVVFVRANQWPYATQPVREGE